MKPIPRGVRTAILVCMWCSAAVATHLPPSEMPKESLVNDKVIHFVVFGVLGLLAAWRLAADRRLLTFRGLAAWCLALVAYGLLDEMTQPLVGRTFEWLDWAADAAGASFGMLAVGLCRSRGDSMTHGGDADAAS